MKHFCHIFTIIGALAAGWMLLETLNTAIGAPQQAAGAAFALAFVVIPYCFARAVEELGSWDN